MEEAMVVEETAEMEAAVAAEMEVVATAETLGAVQATAAGTREQMTRQRGRMDPAVKPALLAIKEIQAHSQDAADPSSVSDQSDPATLSAIDIPRPTLPLMILPSVYAVRVLPVVEVAENGTAAGLVGLPGAGLRRSATTAVHGARIDVGINAVIVVGLRCRGKRIGKGPGVRNVAVTGGIIALGETALAKPSPGVSSRCER